MANYIDSEQKVRDLFPKGASFNFEGKTYTVAICDKPRPSKGECKTDVYIKGIAADNEEIEIKISVKQSNADFLENKISLERAFQILGNDAVDIIKKSTLSIKDKFEEDYLVYFTAPGKQEGKTMKLGWKFELLNKQSGEKSNALVLTDEQKIEIYSGKSLPEDKRNSKVDGVIIKDSGVANFILNLEDKDMTQVECLNRLEPIADFAKKQNIYFACKALNYRYEKGKWDGPRPLAVYVDWFINKDGKLDACLRYDEPLMHNGNEIGKNLKNLMEELKIKTFGGLKKKLAKTVKCHG
ncbi:MAG: hypothetical protein K2M11_01380 [Paramuribaculum sp.]|nr:hypothetical protein [Paramuribaculum sp.]